MPPHAIFSSNDGVAALNEEDETLGDTIEIQYDFDNRKSLVECSIDESNIRMHDRKRSFSTKEETNDDFLLLDNDDIFDALTNTCAFLPPPPLRKKSAMKKPRGDLKLPAAAKSIHNSRSVSFNSVQIREHEITLGDHPSSANGPPIQLGWEAKNESTFDLDKYEKNRKPLRRKRRQLKMSFREREERLSSSGFTMDQLKNAWMEALKVRQQRYETITRGWSATKIEEAWESACRKFQRIFTLSNEEEGIEVQENPLNGQSLWSYVISNDDGTPITSWFSLECACGSPEFSTTTQTTTSDSNREGKNWSNNFLPRLTL